MVLDTAMRNQLRVLGVLVCLFGSSILSSEGGKGSNFESILCGLSPPVSEGGSLASIYAF
jgi:hypothetical protein